MRRREFIKSIGGWAVAWPLAAHAQQPSRPVIGFLSTRSRDESARLLPAFQRGLAQGGYADGQNVIIEYRWALSQYDRLGVFAGELVRQPVNMIVAVGGEPSARAAKAATATIPGKAGLIMTAMVVACGTSSRKSPSRLGSRALVRSLMPVDCLPVGRGLQRGRWRPGPH